jgi:UPF0176 protein
LLCSSFYKFVEVAEPEGLRAHLLEICAANDIRGSIILAREGINATLSGAPNNLHAFFSWLRQDSRFEDIEAKLSLSAIHAFDRLKVRVKPEIVTFGMPLLNPPGPVGNTAPKDWNALIQSTGVIVIDTRNDYEFKTGTFRGAVNPRTRSFRQFPEFINGALDASRDKKIALFCTGGIRCEKAASYLIERGFQEIYRLQGGILKYLEEIGPAGSLWEGECFVFDKRVALAHGGAGGTHALCIRCGAPSRAQGPSGAPACEDCIVAEAGNVTVR